MMQTIYAEHKTFEKIDFTKNALEKGEYDHCTFLNCDFSGSDLTESKFSGGEFIGCNLSLVKLHQTAFRAIHFKECKMLGLQFENCNQFGLSFTFIDCNLSHSSFYQSKIKKTTCENCILQTVDFTESDLSSSNFDNCDFTNAIFQNTIIEKADFRTSINYSIHPEINQIKKAKFSLSGISGLLEHYDIVIEK